MVAMCTRGAYPGVRRGRRPPAALAVRFAAVVGTYASALLISLAAVVLGRGALLLCGHAASSWLGPALGLALLLVLCEVAIRAPGRAWSAVVAMVALCGGALWLGHRRGAPWPPWRMGLAVAAGVLALASVPFLANWRVGVLGISFLNDTHWHLLLAEGLRQPAIQGLETFGPGYPLGPHAIAATFAQLLGSDVDRTLTGLLMAVPVLTGLVALGALEHVSAGRRWLVAVLVGLPYLAAAWYVQSAFKEPLVGLFVIATALTLELGRRERYAHPARLALPLAVLAAGVVYAYSLPGVVWPAAIVAVWIAAELLASGLWRRPGALWRALRPALSALALAALVLLVLIAPDLGRIHTFLAPGSASLTSGGVLGIDQSALANLVAPLRALEGFGIWLGEDFRVVPPDHLQTDVLGAFAVLAAVFGVAHALARRELAWPAALLACAAVFVYSNRYQSPYVAAKALAVPGPLVALVAGRALMEQLERRRLLTLAGVALGLVAAAYFGLSLRSSYLVLRGAEVGPQQHLRELRALRPRPHGAPTLALFYDDYFKWELLGVRAGNPILPSVLYTPVSPSKPWSYGQELDFDSLDAAVLDRVEYAITPATLAQSAPPPNFHRVRSTRSYTLWRRIGPTPVRHTLPGEAGGAFGAVLDCSTAAGRRVAALRGVARVRPAPVYGRQLPPLYPGGSSADGLALGRGRWQLSLPFVSPQAVRVRAPGLDATLPPNLDRPGAPWSIGTVRSAGGAVSVRVSVEDPSPLHSTSQFMQPGRLVAVRADAAPRTLPLRRACGRFVDSYTLSR